MKTLSPKTEGRILITGHSGYLGSWVAEDLRRRFPEVELHGAARRPEAGGIPGASAPDLDGVHELDLRRADQVAELVRELAPVAVVHLASQRGGALRELLEVNVIGLESLLQAIAVEVPKARVLVAGSAAELGRAGGQETSLAEDAFCEPVDSYGLSKLAQSALAHRYALTGLSIQRLRVFNLIGPSMPDSLLPGRCARLLFEASTRGDVRELQFGSLGTLRDYVDVRDAARAFGAALEAASDGSLYHIATGVSRSGRDVVERLISLSGIEGLRCVENTGDPSIEVARQSGNGDRARRDLGWEPRVAWEDSLRDLLGSLDATVSASSGSLVVRLPE